MKYHELYEISRTGWVRWYTTSTSLRNLTNSVSLLCVCTRGNMPSHTFEGQDCIAVRVDPRHQEVTEISRTQWVQNITNSMKFHKHKWVRWCTSSTSLRNFTNSITSLLCVHTCTTSRYSMIHELNKSPKYHELNKSKISRTQWVFYCVRTHVNVSSHQF